jgi:dienelactone hydrolase
VRTYAQRFAFAIVWTLHLVASPVADGTPQDRLPLPGTAALELEGDIASHLVAGVDKFLLREIEAAKSMRATHWKRDASSAEAFERSIAPNRKRLAHILGVRDARVPFDGVSYVGGTAQAIVVGHGEQFAVFAVRWPAFGDVHAEGLLLVPAGAPPGASTRAVADVVVVPDADQLPEALVGLVPGLPPESQIARRLAESGCRVLIPTLIDRKITQHRLTNREFLYRSAFEMGRHLIGYEVQKVLAAVDWFERDAKENARDAKIGVVGWGEGGLLALHAGALDNRIDSVCVSGYFDAREGVWKEPIYRNVFGLLEQFGDAELACMIVPRTLVVEAAVGPETVVPSGTGGGPGRLTTPELASVKAEVARATALVVELGGELAQAAPTLVVSGDGEGPFGSAPALEAFLRGLGPSIKLAPLGSPSPEHARANFDPDARQRRQIHEIDRHTQWLLRESPYVRKEFMKKLDTSSVEKYETSIEWYRTFFYDEVIGRFDKTLLPPKPRSRKSYDEDGWTGYEVVLDVFPDVIAYGILLVPKDIKPGERRPVVVCQHGLEGRPQDTIGKPGFKYYKAFAASLAKRGFVTFAPQNLYIFQDRFRTLQRKSNPIKKTLYSVIVPQHQQIVDWLQTQPFVDPERIGFYGLSYGGKTAMRVPPLVADYKFSICSADFNEWVWKNASTRSRYSYVGTGEYEIFEFDLGSTFNYSEMAALIAPRPFMVERGHFDGVAPDETVGYEFAKVRFLYSARLGLGDRCEIEWFVGPHSINSAGTFDFCHRHLDWPRR